MTEQIFIGFNGLQSDAQTFSQLLTYEVNSYKLRENRDISPEAFASLVSTIQFKHRFGPYFIEPVIAGLDKVGFSPFPSIINYAHSFSTLCCSIYSIYIIYIIYYI